MVGPELRLFPCETEQSRECTGCYSGVRFEVSERVERCRSVEENEGIGVIHRWKIVG